MKPAEGTILTVSRLAAERALEAADENSSAEYVLEAALKRGKEVLPDTMQLNPVLKKAGVVDAGAKGFLVLMEAALQALRGNVTDYTQASVEQAESKGNFSNFVSKDITFSYCTEFIVSRKTSGTLRRSGPFLTVSAIAPLS
jgi:dihydroxyacetone kinase-like predicted kinase